MIKTLTQKITLGVSTFATLATIFIGEVKAFAQNTKFAPTGDQFSFPKIDALLSGFINFLQYIAGAYAIITLITAGFKLFTSADRSGTFEDSKFEVLKVVLGCALVFLAPYLFGLIYEAVQK